VKEFSLDQMLDRWMLTLNRIVAKVNER
jgi:hypothetical protein